MKKASLCTCHIYIPAPGLQTHHASILAHDDAIWSVAWGTNKKESSETVVTGSLDDLVKVWKWRDEKLDLQWSLEGHQLGVVSVDISHTLPIAASSSLDAHIRLWDLENGKQIKSIDAGPVDAWTLAFSPDSQYLATGTHVGKVNIFGVESGKKEYSLDTRGKFILSIAYYLASVVHRFILCKLGYQITKEDVFFH
uniref:Superkiller complex protein 8 n=1 Tax=Balaenoptera musculus TaxID=9771 RepID=A0A8C0DCQ5_BALMU